MKKIFLLVMLMVVFLGMITPQNVFSAEKIPLPELARTDSSHDAIDVSCDKKDIKKRFERLIIRGYNHIDILGNSDESIYGIRYVAGNLQTDKAAVVAVAVAEDKKVPVTKKRVKIVPQIIELWVRNQYYTEDQIKKYKINTEEGIDNCAFMELLLDVYKPK